MKAPNAPAYLRPPTRRADGWLWIVPNCPHCHRQHVHGAGMDGTVGGHRVAHCMTGRPNHGYVLTRIEAPK